MAASGRRSLWPALGPALALALLMAAVLPARAQQGKKTVTTIRVTVTVVNPKDKPVQGAGVVLKQLRDANGRIPREPFDVELHTDERGQVTVQGFEPGDVLVQVIDTAYNTWGQAFVLSKPNEAIHVQLKAPQAQVSACCR